MSVSKSEKRFAEIISKIAGMEAKKLGLQPQRFTGAFVEDAYIFEIQFEPKLRPDTICQGKA